MKSTRDKVLQKLASNPRSAIVDVAEAVGINAISVRHHLTSLQAANLVKAEEERHGVGRPRLVYSLTEDGMENFPTRYYSLTNQLINSMKAILTTEEINNVFRNMSDLLSEDYLPQFKSLNFDEKLKMLESVLAKEGYDFTTSKDGDDFQIINNTSCPYHQISKNHVEICLFDKSLIAKLLSIPEDKIIYFRNNENLCTFHITEIEYD